MQIKEIVNLPHSERWSRFTEMLKDRGLSLKCSPADYPDDIREIFQAIHDQDFRDANNGSAPVRGSIRDTDLFRKISSVN